MYKLKNTKVTKNSCSKNTIIKLFIFFEYELQVVKHFANKFYKTLSKFNL